MDFYKFIIYIIHIFSNYDVKLFEDKRYKLVVDESAYLVYLQIFEDLHVIYDRSKNLNAIMSHLG